MNELFGKISACTQPRWQHGRPSCPTGPRGLQDAGTDPGEDRGTPATEAAVPRSRGSVGVHILPGRPAGPGLTLPTYRCPCSDARGRGSRARSPCCQHDAPLCPCWCLQVPECPRAGAKGAMPTSAMPGRGLRALSATCPQGCPLCEVSDQPGLQRPLPYRGDDIHCARGSRQRLTQEGHTSSDGRREGGRKKGRRADGGRPQTPSHPGPAAVWSAARASAVQAPGRRPRPREPAQAPALTLSSTRFRRAPIELLPRSFVFSVG